MLYRQSMSTNIVFRSGRVTSWNIHAGRVHAFSTIVSNDVGSKQILGEDTKTHSTENDSGYSSEKQTHFGFGTVSESEKAHKVKAVFETVAQKYDLMNDVMSFGVHRIWKDILLSRLNPGRHTRLIDVAGGTGDIAFRFLKYTNLRRSVLPASIPIPISILSKTSADLAQFSEKPAKNEGEALEAAAGVKHQPSDNSNKDGITRSVLVCDINPKMIEVGKTRSKSMLSPEQLQRIDWMEGNAENLKSIPDNSFDAYTIAFGVRNCVRIDRVLSEAYRVLRPGGRFLCLEFSHVENPALKWVYDKYSFQMIPVMGQIMVGDWDSYQYLVESIRKFPEQEEFKRMIEDVGFRFTKYEDLTFGVARIHTGFKI